MENWRFILHPPYPGAWNMVVDEAILESVAKKENPPTLRLYGWCPYALSLGHAQCFADVDLPALQANGWDIVRRPTGGRAILHADELTYSICAPQDDSHVSGNVLESYRLLSNGLLKGLQLAGITADSQPSQEKDKQILNNPVCFQHPSDYEITWQGRKLIGSAQARRHNGILQHGSIPLNGDIGRIVSVLAYAQLLEREKARENLIQRAVTVSEVLGRPVSWQDMADCVTQGFSQALDLQFQPARLTPAEKLRSFQLLKEKYANDPWTQRM